MRVVAMLMLLALAGCPKKEAPIANEEAGMPATPSATPSAGAIPPDASASPPNASASFAGKYGLTPGTLYVGEADKAAVKFKNDETKFLGEGDISISIDPTGRVSGTTEAGPLGATIVEGKSEGGTVTATIRRKDALDEGLTGTLVAKLTGDSLEGTMKLSEFNAAVVREATLKAKRK